MKKQFTISSIIIFLALGYFFFAGSAHAETEISGNITSNTIWTLTSSPYIVTATVQVLEGAKLTIESGVVVKFNPETSLQVGGELVAIGNQDQKIVFTSNQSNPKPGDWVGIFFTEKSTDAVTDGNSNYISGSIIKNSIIEYTRLNRLSASPFISNNIIRYNYNTGYAISLDYSNSIIVNNLIDNNFGTAINVYFSGAKIRNNTITNNLTAFQISGGTSEISKNIIKNNKSGFYLQFQANPKIQYNNVFENGGDNIRMAQNTDIKVDYNYWGTTNTSIIESGIHDYYDLISLGKVYYEPYALSELKFDGTDTFSQPSTCTSWVYSGWSTCQSNGIQTRTVTSSSPSGCVGGNPVLTQSCTYTPPTCTSWTYSDWSTCVNNQQTRTITSSQPANCAGGNPILNQSCNSTPLCTENNWTSILSPTICPSSGQQTKKWTKVGECQGGIFRSSEETVSCDYQVPTCTNFTYSDWGACNSSGVQSRTTLSASPSGCTGGNPVLSKSCNYVPPCISDSWSCGDWSNCLANNSQTRTCTKTFDCPNVQTESPITNQHCEISNQNSQNVKEPQVNQIQNEPTPIKNNEQAVNQEKNTTGSQAEQRRSEVANAVQEILQVAEKDSGIGEQVKIIAQTQTQNQEKLETSLQKVQSRSGFAKFFVGPNYGEINNAKKLLEQNREQIKQLGQIKNQLANQDDQQKLTEQVQLLEQSNQEIENSLNTLQRGFSLFGWIFRLFVK